MEKGYILGFWRNIKTRCQNPECGRSITKAYEIRPNSYGDLPESIKEIAPIGRYCPHCAKKMAQKVAEAIEEENK